MKINIEIITENGTGKNICGEILIDDRLLDVVPDKVDFIAQELKPWIESILESEPRGETK
jgi:hypothetical protein